MPYPTNEYLNLITRQHKKRPKFAGYVRAIVDPVASLQALLNDIKTWFSVDTAVGVQLDAVGKWVGATRFIEQEIVGVWFEWDEDVLPSTLGWDIGYWQGLYDADTAMSALDDETFRLVIYAKIILNSWRGETGALIEAWAELLTAYGITLAVVDNLDLSIDVYYFGVPDTPVVKAIIERGGLPINPAGVLANFKLPDGVVLSWNAPEALSTFGGFGGSYWS